MPIFKYTFKKYIKAPSTWIITVISMLLIVVLAGIVALNSLKLPNAMSYATLSFGVVSAMTSFLAIFTSVFAGFKAATMYKDEVEDGTFLVMLSKPISRSKIIFSKWMALVLILLMYTFIISVTFLFTIAIFDRGDTLSNLKIGNIQLSTLRSKSIPIAGVMWLILFVTSLIFASIAILLSTKLSVGATIGITATIGIIIPITSMIGLFLRKPEYKPINTNQANVMNEFRKKELPNRLPAGFSPTLATPNLYDLGLYTKDKDHFGNLFWADIDFQMNTLASFAMEQIIPKEAEKLIQSDSESYMVMGLPPIKYIPQSNFKFENKLKSTKEILNKMITNSFKYFDPIRQLYLIPKMKEIFGKLFADSKVNLGNDSNPISASSWGVGMGTKYEQFSKDLGIKVNNGNDDPTKINKEFFDQFTSIKLDPNYSDLKKAEYYSLAWKIARVFKAKQNKFFHSKNYKKASQEFVNKYGVWFTDAISYIINPLSAIFETAIDSFTNRKNFDEEPGIEYSLSKDDLQNSKETSKVALNIIQLEPSISDMNKKYSSLVKLSTKGFHLVKISSKKYINRYILLYIYIGIAIGLIPIAYLVVRKQDFR